MNRFCTAMRSAMLNSEGDSNVRVIGAPCKCNTIASGWPAISGITLRRMSPAFAARPSMRLRWSLGMMAEVSARMRCPRTCFPPLSSYR